MNKKIYKGYELIEAIANGKIENYTKIIPHYPNDNCTAEYFEYAHGFIKVCYKDGCYRNSKYDNDVNVCIFLDNNRSFEILEDNTEEIEELDRNLKFDDLITPYGKNEDMMWTEIIKQHNKIDEIIRYIKRKDKSND